MTTASTPSTPKFQTPPRILIPKLLRSRDAWKRKATARKTHCKTLQIRVRDLTVSRDRHRQHAQQLQEQLEKLQLQLQHTQHQRDQLQSRLDAVAPSSSPARLPPKTIPTPSDPAADTTLSH